MVSVQEKKKEVIICLQVRNGSQAQRLCLSWAVRLCLDQPTAQRGLPTAPCNEVAFCRLLLGKGHWSIWGWDCTTTTGTVLDMVRGIQIPVSLKRERAGEKMKGKNCKVVWIQKHWCWLLKCTSLWKAEPPFSLVEQNCSHFSDHVWLTFSLAETECNWFCCLLGLTMNSNKGVSQVGTLMWHHFPFRECSCAGLLMNFFLNEYH